MKKTNRQKKWKFLIIFIWILFLAAVGIGCYSLRRASDYEIAETELSDQGKIISRQFDSLVETNFNAWAGFYERLISEVKALAFALEDYDDIEEAHDLLEDIINTTEIKNLWIYDRDGNIVFGSSDAPEDPIELKDIPIYLDSEPYKLDETVFDTEDKYQTTTYLLDKEKNNLIWGVKDRWFIYVDDFLSDELKDVVDFFDWDQVIQDISVGRDGSVLAVSEIDGSVLSYSDPDAKGKPVEELNIRIAGNDGALSVGQLVEAFSQEGEVKEIEVDSVRYYATRIGIDTDLFLVMFPASEINEEIMVETVFMMLPMFLLTGIGVLYLFCLAAEHKKQLKDNPENAGGPLVPIGKLKVFTILAVILIFVLSLYLETHLVYSQMFLYTSTTAEDVMEKKNDSDIMLKAIQKWLDTENLEKSRIARCIIQHAGQKKADRQYITDLADRLKVRSLYVFDNDGTVSVTNAPYDGRIIDQDSPFHALLEGTESVIVPSDQKNASGEVQQEAGVMMLDESNRVSGAVVITGDILSLISGDLSFETVFQRVFLKDNTVVMAVDSENMKVRYFAQVDGSFLMSDQLAFDYKEGDLAALGIDEKLVRDYYNGEMFAVNGQYFCSVRRNDNAFLMVLRPMVFIDAGSLLFVICITAASLLFFILLIFIAGRYRTVPEEDSEAEDDQKAEKEIDKDEKDKDDVLTLLGSFVNSNKPYFEERWPADGKKWKQKSPMEKFSIAVKLICIITLILIILYAVIGGEKSVFYYSFTGEWSSGINLYSITSCVIEIIVLVLLKQIIHKILYLIARAVQRRGETVCNLLDSFSGYVLLIAGVFIILGTLGVDVTAMSLTAGVAGIIFGIGCQNVVSDILAGIIMAFEGSACAGDFISFNGQFGTIQSIGVRTTRLKWFSEITIVRNNDLKNYINMPGNKKDRVTVNLCIDLKESLTRVEGVIDEELPKIHETLCTTVGDEIKLKYRGVQGIEESGIKLSFAVFCKGIYYGWVRRLLSRELLLMCERNQIRLAMPQIVINQREDVYANEND